MTKDRSVFKMLQVVIPLCLLLTLMTEEVSGQSRCFATIGRCNPKNKECCSFDCVPLLMSSCTSCLAKSCQCRDGICINSRRPLYDYLIHDRSSVINDIAQPEMKDSKISASLWRDIVLIVSLLFGFGMTFTNILFWICTVCRGSSPSNINRRQQHV